MGKCRSNDFSHNSVLQRSNVPEELLCLTIRAQLGSEVTGAEIPSLEDVESSLHGALHGSEAKPGDSGSAVPCLVTKVKKQWSYASTSRQRLTNTVLLYQSFTVGNVN